MKVVSPYKPFAPESEPHLKLGPFDWGAALSMMGASVSRACGCQTFALTDETATLPIEAYRYRTTEPRLMLWILEVSLAYLSSPQFDEDTVLVSPDVLVLGDLRTYFAADLTVLIRTDPKFAARPIMNGMQWWRHDARERLIAFYRQALAVARVLSDEMITWGADSDALRVLLEPTSLGIHARSGCDVSMVECESVLRPLTSQMMRAIDRGRTLVVPDAAPAIDFKYATRKPYMARVWQALS